MSFLRIDLKKNRFDKIIPFAGPGYRNELNVFNVEIKLTKLRDNFPIKKKTK